MKRLLAHERVPKELSTLFGMRADLLGMAGCSTFSSTTLMSRGSSGISFLQRRSEERKMFLSKVSNAGFRSSERRPLREETGYTLRS